MVKPVSNEPTLIFTLLSQQSWKNPTIGDNGDEVIVGVGVGVGVGQLKQVIKFVITKFGSEVGRLTLFINILL
jgi:hypothetical protein